MNSRLPLNMEIDYKQDEIKSRASTKNLVNFIENDATNAPERTILMYEKAQYNRPNRAFITNITQG